MPGCKKPNCISASKERHFNLKPTKSDWMSDN